MTNTAKFGAAATGVFDGAFDSAVQGRVVKNDFQPADFDIIENPFKLIERTNGDFTVFAPKGRLNDSTRKYFKDRLYDIVSSPEAKIIFNCRFVDSIDSVGLGIIVSAHKKAVSYGGMLVLTDMSDRIQKTMETLHMDRYLNITSDMKSALEIMPFSL